MPINQLNEAIKSNNFTQVQQLLKNGAELVDDLTNLENDSLFLAIASGNPKILRLILESGAKIADGDPEVNQHNSLFYAINYVENEEITDLLLAYGANVSQAFQVEDERLESCSRRQGQLLTKRRLNYEKTRIGNIATTLLQDTYLTEMEPELLTRICQQSISSTESRTYIQPKDRNKIVEDAINFRKEKNIRDDALKSIIEELISKVEAESSTEPENSRPNENPLPSQSTPLGGQSSQCQI